MKLRFHFYAYGGAKWQCDLCGRKQIHATDIDAIETGTAHVCPPELVKRRERTMSYTPQHAAVADPKRPYKAYATAAVSAVGTFVAAWVMDTDPFTAKEAGEAALMAVVASGVTGGVGFTIRNPIVTKPTDTAR